MDLKDHIRSIPDFPKPGILFYDISTLLANAKASHETIEQLAPAVRPHKLLRLIVHLEDHGNEAFSDLDQLQVRGTFQGGLSVPRQGFTRALAGRSRSNGICRK